jgi:hypothetical protein
MPVSAFPPALMAKETGAADHSTAAMVTITNIKRAVPFAQVIFLLSYKKLFRAKDAEREINLIVAKKTPKNRRRTWTHITAVTHPLFIKA